MLGDLKQLRAFLAIARLGNFTRAAYELNISQSALTIQIQQLETHLRTHLFDRNRRSVNLTPQGLELLPRIERVVTEIEDLVTHAREASDPERGTVTVAALPSLAAGLLPHAIHRPNREHPGITVRIRDTVASRLTYMIRNGEVDFGVGSPVKRDQELVWDKLMTDRFCAFVAPDYPWTTQDTVTLKDLAGPPLILPVRESSIRMHIEAAADKNKISLPAAYEAVYNSTIMAMAAQGLGVAILSELVARGGDTSRLRRISIDNPPLYRYIGILRRAGRSLSRPAELLAEALREVASVDPTDEKKAPRSLAGA